MHMPANVPQAPIAVIGAGIIGACVAACLQRDGHAVMLLDPEEPGASASSGSAGTLSTSSIIPVGMPGIARKVPGWLLDPQGPLTLRWRCLPAIAPLLLRLLRANGHVSDPRPPQGAWEGVILRTFLSTVEQEEIDIPSPVMGYHFRGHFRTVEIAPDVGEWEGSVPSIVKWALRMRLVLDSEVDVARTHSPSGASAALLLAALERRLMLCTNVALMPE